MLANAGSTPETCPCHQDNSSAPAQLVYLSNGAAMDIRLMEQACGCSTVCGGGGPKVRCSSLPAIIRWRVLVTSTTPLHLQVLCLCNGHPTDRASELAPASWCKVEAGSRCVLAASRWCSDEECLPQAPRPQHLQVVCLCNGAAMDPRLMVQEQACGCSMVRVRGRLKVGARRLPLVL